MLVVGLCDVAGVRVIALVVVLVVRVEEAADVCAVLLVRTGEGAGVRAAPLIRAIALCLPPFESIVGSALVIGTPGMMLR